MIWLRFENSKQKICKMKRFVVWFMFFLAIFEFINVIEFFGSSQYPKNRNWVDPNYGRNFSFFFSNSILNFISKEMTPAFARLNLMLTLYLGLLRLAFFFSPDNFWVYLVILVTHLTEAAYFFRESFIFGSLKLEKETLLKQSPGNYKRI